MSQTPDERLLRQASDLAKALAIRLHVYDGRISQTPRPGGALPNDVQVDPPLNAYPEMAARYRFMEETDG